MNIINRLKGLSAFAKNVLIVGLGSGLSQVITFAFTPILTRIYSPEQYGLVAGYTAVWTIVAVFTAMQYPSAVVAEKEDEGAFLTVMAAISSSVIMSLLCALACLILSLTSNPGALQSLFYLVFPIHILLYGVISALTVWSIRHKQYRQNAICSIVHVVSLSVLSIVFGLLGLGAAGLILGNIIASAVNFICIFLVVVKKTNINSFQFKWSSIISKAVELKNYPLLHIPSVLLNSGSAQIVVLLFKGSYPPSQVGSYSKSISLTNAPLSLLGQAIQPVFYQGASRIYHEQEISDLRRQTLNAYQRLVLFVALPTFIIFGFGDWLFQFILGQEWLEGGTMARILMPSLAIHVVTGPLSSLVYVRKKLKQETMLSILFFIVRLAAVGICIFLSLPFLSLLIVYSICDCILWIMYNSFILGLGGVNFFEGAFFAIMVLGGSCCAALLARSMLLYFL